MMRTVFFFLSSSFFDKNGNFFKKIGVNMLKNNEKAFHCVMKGDEFLDIKNTGIKEQPL